MSNYAYRWKNAEKTGFFEVLEDCLMRYLLVVAHPDDEVIGAGGSIYKLINEGHELAVAIMSNGAEARRDLSKELNNNRDKAMSILGVKEVYSNDFPNIKMNTVAHLDLVQFIESCIEDFQAEAIITHHPTDTNVDHRVTSKAAQVAGRLFQRRPGIPKLQEMLYMEVLSSTEWSLDTSLKRFIPNYFIEIGEEGVERKLKALSEYEGVMREYPHPRSVEALRGLAAYRGAQSGCNYAEAFECVYKRA